MKPPLSPHANARPRGRPPSGLLATSVLAGCVAFVLAFLPLHALPRTQVAWRFTAQQDAARPAPPGMAVVYSPSQAIIRFSVGGYRGPELVAGGIPISRAVDCRTQAVADEADPVGALGRLSFDQATGFYSYRWVIDRAWRGTCRRLDLRFPDGSRHAAVLYFVDPAEWLRDNGSCGHPQRGGFGRLNSLSLAPDRARSC